MTDHDAQAIAALIREANRLARDGGTQQERDALESRKHDLLGAVCESCDSLTPHPTEVDGFLVCEECA